MTTPDENKKEQFRIVSAGCCMLCKHFDVMYTKEPCCSCNELNADAEFNNWERREDNE